MSSGKIILKTDLDILNKILFPNSKRIVVFDPDNISSFSPDKNFEFCQDEKKLTSILKNIDSNFTFASFAKFSIPEIKKYSLLEGIFDFSKKRSNTFTKFYFINNPDGSMRWVFPKDNQTPCFLNLYNGSGWKANLFSTASKFLNSINFLQPIVSGQFSVFFKNKTKFESSFDGIPFNDFAIFTGTIGENRKAIVALSKNKKCTHFIKTPLTKSSLKLVENEYQQLRNLENNNFSFTSIPKSKITNSGIAVSNVLPEVKYKNQEWSSKHWQSLNELYQYSFDKKILGKTPFWKTIKDGIEFLQKPFVNKNGLSKEVLNQLKNSVEELYYKIDSTKRVPVGIGHGDFTPWNMYVGKERLHIYDWEMSQFDFPILFDVFHYFFQKGILIDRQNYSSLKTIIKTKIKDENAQKILNSFSVEWEDHFRLYLLYIVCYYLPKYISQPKLHDQVHWLTKTWIEALQNLNQGIATTDSPVLR